jgi:hypothetical protein
MFPRREPDASPAVAKASEAWRWACVAAIALALAGIVLRGRGGKPITVAEAVKATTGGAFYHWREFRRAEGRFLLEREGWCALRRSRTLAYSPPGAVIEERRSPSGVVRWVGKRVVRNSGSVVAGMEAGQDFLTHAATHLSGPEAILRPLGGRRYRAGEATYTLERGSIRVVGIDTPGQRVTIDYPTSLDSDIFEARG